MTTGSPCKLLLQFSIPILIENLFQQAYTLSDRIIVGRYVGDTAFSAIDATNALSMTFMSMCMGAAIGTGVVVSQHFGAKDEKGTAASIANGSCACILIAIAMTLIALITTKPLLLLLKTPESLMPDALTYLYIFMGGLIAVVAYFTPFSILRALGDSKTPLIFLILCSLLNIGLDLLLVIVFTKRCRRCCICDGILRSHRSRTVSHLCVSESTAISADFAIQENRPIPD